MTNACSVGMEPVKKDRYALSPEFRGEEQCAAGHCWGAGVRSTYVIHYVISGEGVFYCGPSKYTVRAGQIFVIFPGTVVKYQADQRDPWHYAWIGFYGDEAKEIFSQVGISVQNPVITLKDGAAALALLRDMPTERSAELKLNLAFKANLYAFMSLLMENASQTRNRENVYLSTAVKYIKAHYSEDITVDQVASHVGIGRKYLFAIFKKAMNLSPKDYIIYYRMERAKEFLQDALLPIGNVAYSVGYRDQLTFSKMFKLKTGYAPSEYRKNHTDQK